MIDKFYSANDLPKQFRIAVELTEYVLEPVGGMWKKGEVLGCGTTAGAENLGIKAEQIFQMLLGSEKVSAQ